jgi:hypothetical protein
VLSWPGLVLSCLVCCARSVALVCCGQPVSRGRPRQKKRQRERCRIVQYRPWARRRQFVGHRVGRLRSKPSRIIGLLRRHWCGAAHAIEMPQQPGEQCHGYHGADPRTGGAEQDPALHEGLTEPAAVRLLRAGGAGPDGLRPALCLRGRAVQSGYSRQPAQVRAVAHVSAAVGQRRAGGWLRYRLRHARKRRAGAAHPGGSGGS